MATAIRFAGEGPGPQSLDGCSVELFRRIPATGEPEIVASVVPAGGRILELGSGPGRVTHPLIALGYEVTAVDNSSEMLSHIKGATTILSDIETLALESRFDAVLLASLLINFPDRNTRAALLACCSRHVKPGGAVLIERHDPVRLAAAQPGPRGEIAGVQDFVDAVRREGQLVHLVVRSRAADGEWTQSCTLELIDDSQMEGELSDAGLRLVRWLNPSKTWALATTA
ncbi:MAG: class I SAM-dependent methyltransferase [Inquilinus sp.]|uniref:class I SAM-dependent methyltransferase n=1 Tax=Inquilinus sp. TaxID=1932117 RepID=UPI003F2CC9A3